MDREIFNEFDRAFQEGKQKILNNKEEELSYEYKERLQAANDSFVTRLKVISQSNYSYSDRKEIDDQERQRFETIKAEVLNHLRVLHRNSRRSLYPKSRPRPPGRSGAPSRSGAAPSPATRGWRRSYRPSRLPLRSS